ncbi:8377_t:CDS:2, partial [Scutellospora calospora]
MSSAFLFTLANRNRGTLEVLKFHDRNTCISEVAESYDKCRFDSSLFDRLAKRCPKLRVLELHTYHQETNPNNARRQHLEKLQVHRRLKDVQFYFCNIDDLKSYYYDQ